MQVVIMTKAVAQLWAMGVCLFLTLALKTGTAPQWASSGNSGTLVKMLHRVSSDSRSAAKSYIDMNYRTKYIKNNIKNALTAWIYEKSTKTHRAHLNEH